MAGDNIVVSSDSVGQTPSARREQTVNLNQVNSLRLTESQTRMELDIEEFDSWQESMGQDTGGRETPLHTSEKPSVDRSAFIKQLTVTMKSRTISLDHCASSMKFISNRLSADGDGFNFTRDVLSGTLFSQSSSRFVPIYRHNQAEEVS